MIIQKTLQKLKLIFLKFRCLTARLRYILQPGFCHVAYGKLKISPSWFADIFVMSMEYFVMMCCFFVLNCLCAFYLVHGTKYLCFILILQKIIVFEILKCLLALDEMKLWLFMENVTLTKTSRKTKVHSKNNRYFVCKIVFKKLDYKFE